MSLRAVTNSLEFTAKDGRRGVVRPARRSDAAPCVAIVKETTMMRPRTIMTTTSEVWGVTEWRRRMLNLGDDAITFVAAIDETVAGLLGAVRGDRPVTRHTAELGITIGERFRGLGAGRALMEAFEHWARSLGIERAVLGVYETNDVARKLYESMGYEVEGVERRGVKFPEGYVDTIRMAKFL